MRLAFNDLTYLLFGISFVSGAKKGACMMKIKYLLGKTGLFPRWEPESADVLKAAFRAYEIRKFCNSRGKKYFCIIPGDRDATNIYHMAHVFRKNGVFLIPKFPKETNRIETVVFWVRDRGQQFMRDAIRVNQNANNFQQVLARYNNRKDTVLKKLFGKFENEK